MIGALSAVTLFLGAATAYAAEHVPSKLKLLESCGGALLVAGLALLGSALPLFP
ncbi:MAG: hypothetical protein QOI12_1651 [Alphaproteobacteria bacterium]|jgi:hypothetical protein|nr:hypothetical protein [Alphaproteobacteria bacterium]